MEDRPALLRELQKQILRRMVPEAELEAAQFKEDEVKEYFRKKLPAVERREDIPALLERVGALNLLQQKPPSVFEYAPAGADVRTWGGDLMEAGKGQSVWTPRGNLWGPTEGVPVYAAGYAPKPRLKAGEESAGKAPESGPARRQAP